MGEDIRELPGVHIAFDCPVCGARQTGGNTGKIKCPRCGLKGTLRVKAELVVESGPTKKAGKDGVWR